MSPTANSATAFHRSNSYTVGPASSLRKGALHRSASGAASKPPIAPPRTFSRSNSRNYDRDPLQDVKEQRRALSRSSSNNLYQDLIHDVKQHSRTFNRSNSNKMHLDLNTGACTWISDPEQQQSENESRTLHQQFSTEEQPYPFLWTPLSKEEKMKRREVYFANGPWCVSPKASMLDLVRSAPGGVLMPRQFTNMAEAIYNFELRPDDVFVVTYPKCGTTWTQEMVWQILHDMDVEGGRRESIMTRSPYLEMQSLTDDGVNNDSLDNRAVNALALAESMPSPRVIKTHLPLDMLPPDLLDVCKVVFVARNPMDCCVSFYHHERLVPQMGFAGTFDQYADLFRRGNNPMGSYFTHLKSGWFRRHHPNLKFIWFEEMRRDLPSIIDEMTYFLGYRMESGKRAQLADHLHIDNFRNNPSVNMTTNYEKGTFIRKGSVGGWRELFSPDRVRDWKSWIAEETLSTGLHFEIN